MVSVDEIVGYRGRGKFIKAGYQRKRENISDPADIISSDLSQATFTREAEVLQGEN